MKRLLSLLLCLGITGSCLMLSGCSSKSHLTIYSEGNYIQQSILDEFSKKTGILIDYVVGEQAVPTETITETDPADASGSPAAERGSTVSSPAAEAEASAQTATSDSNTASVSSGTDTSAVSASAASVDVEPEPSAESASASASPEPEAEEKPATDPLTALRNWKEAYDAAIAEAVENGKDAETVKTDAPEYDIVLTDGDTVSELITEELLLPLDTSALSNLSNINTEYRTTSYDSSGTYSITCLWETAGLLWNTKEISTQITSWDTLWSEAYTGKILMPRDKRDLAAVALSKLGHSVNTSDATQLTAAYDLLDTQVPYVQAYTAGETNPLMVDGDAWLTPCYSGDAIKMIGMNSDLAFLIPKEGTWRTSFAYCVAAGTKYSDEAFQLLNYLCSSTNLAKNAVYSKFSTTSDAAEKRLDNSWQTNPLAYPDGSILKNAELLTGVSTDATAIHDTRWAQLIDQ